jgi:chloramphenicol-sensitive protein RarD
MDQQDSRKGLAYGIAAYTLWGVFPLYFKLFDGINPLEVLAHRILWSFVLLAVFVTLIGRWPELISTLRRPRVLPTLAASTLLIGVNWFTFLYSISVGDVLQSSLGYFITPLMSVLLGVVLLGERLRGGQLVALTLAGAGVIYMTTSAGAFPWIALTLSVTFSLYGLARKLVAADALLGLLVETMLLAPVSALYLINVHRQGPGAITSNGLGIAALLFGSSIVTTIPLLLFAGSARRLRLSTLGFLQYLAPTLQFLCAVVVFGEAFSPEKMVAFGCIWGAVGLYAADSFYAYQRRTPQAASDELPEEDEPVALEVPAATPCGCDG